EGGGGWPFRRRTARRGRHLSCRRALLALGARYRRPLVGCGLGPHCQRWRLRGHRAGPTSRWLRRNPRRCEWRLGWHLLTGLTAVRFRLRWSAPSRGPLFGLVGRCAERRTPV